MAKRARARTVGVAPTHCGLHRRQVDEERDDCEHREKRGTADEETALPGSSSTTGHRYCPTIDAFTAGSITSGAKQLEMSPIGTPDFVSAGTMMFATK